MADNQTIVTAARIEMDTSKASASAKGLTGDLKNTKSELKSTGAAAQQTGKEIGGAGTHFKGLRDQISTLPGPLGNAAQGATGLLGTFRALLANPIGLVLTALVGILTLLYKGFTATNDGADKMERIFAGISSVIDVFLDRLNKVANSIILIFEGKFTEAAALGREAFIGIGDEIVDEFNKAAEATGKLQEVEDATRRLGVSRAKLNRDLAEAKELMTDENATLEQKRKAIELVREAEGRQTQQELENLQKKLVATRALQNLSDLSDEELQEQADLEAEIFRLQEKSASDQRALNKQSKNIERAAKAQQDAREKEERQKLAEFNTKLLKLQQDNALALIKDGYQKELQSLEFKIQNEKAANQRAFQEKQLTKAQQQKLDAELDIAFANQKAELERKNSEEIAKKDAEFQKELNALNNQTKLAAIRDSREAERVQLQITYEEQLKDAIEKYASNQAQFAEIKRALDAKLAAEQAKIDAEVQLEKDKKELERELASQQKIIEANTFDFDAKRAAVDAEQVLLQQALDNRLITEEEFNTKFEGLAQARISIREQEQQHTQTVVGAIAQTLGNLSNIVGKQTVLGKAFAVAQTAIDTYSSAIAAYKSMAGIPVVGPALGAVAAAAAIANGIAAVKKIVAVEVPGQGTGGGGGISAPQVVTAQAPLAPVAQSTRIVDPNEGSAVGREPVQAFVVESSNRQAVERARRLEANSMFGGG
jgi:hypothetical protein